MARSLEYRDAICGDRNPSLKFWEAVAAGEFDDEVVDWLRVVAQRVLDADKGPAKRRPDAVLAAVGLAGHDDRGEALFNEAYLAVCGAAIADYDGLSPRERPAATRDKMLQWLENNKVGSDWKSWLDRQTRKRGGLTVCMAVTANKVATCPDFPRRTI